MHELDHRGPCLGRHGIYPEGNGEWHWDISVSGQSPSAGQGTHWRGQTADWESAQEAIAVVEPQLEWRNEVAIETDEKER